MPDHPKRPFSAAPRRPRKSRSLEMALTAWICWLSISARAGANEALQLSEFMTDNADALETETGTSPPWIELHNPGKTTLSLEIYRLTTDPTYGHTVALPPRLLPPDGYAVFFLGDNSGELSLDPPDKGGYLALLDHTRTPLTTYHYPAQRKDISYGLSPDGDHRFFPAPTPGRPNNEGVIDFVRDTRFSIDGGFFEAPFELEISSATPDAVIRYTTDGSVPSLFNAKTRTYSGPIAIDRSTVIRAMASRTGWASTNLDTQTYLFPKDTVRQPEFPEGFPTSWGDGPGRNATMPRQSDYEMDPRIRETDYRDMSGQSFGLEDALRDIPSLSLVIDARLLWDPDTGLHAMAENKGREWERPVSVEYFDRSGRRLAHANGGLRMQGGWNRFPEMLKKSFRLYFRKAYGAATFEAPLFPDTPVKKFDTLILRSGNGKAWSSPWRPLEGSTNNSLERTTYLRDEFARVTHADMGHPIAHGSFVHLYINGLYWGLYNLTERLDEHYGKRYLVGTDDDQDVIKWIRSLGRLVNAGSIDAWSETLAAARTRPESLDTYQRLGSMVDFVNLVDYMLTNFYIGNTDWPDNNAYVIRPRLPGGKWHFFCWDSEESLVGTTVNMVNINQSGNISELFQLLRRNPEFQQLLRDRIYKHFFNGGALTDERSIERLMRLARVIDRAVVAESARWGDLLRPSRPYTRDDWTKELDNLRVNYFAENGGAGRNRITLDQLESAGLWQPADTPVIDTSGMADRQEVAVRKRSIFSGGLLYYTTDGSDPRALGGEVGGSAKTGPAVEVVESTTVVRARMKGPDWWGPMEETVVNLGRPADAETIVISELMYHPQEEPDSEFIELWNRSSETVNLRGCRFTEGVSFLFAEDMLLKPGERAVLVSSREAFTARYGIDSARILGDFSGGTRLSNGGERLRLVASTGEDIALIDYSDSDPWPDGADGRGASLVRRADTDLPENSAASWRLSATRHGSPGTVEPPQRFEGDPEGDDNRDGYSNWLHYALSGTAEGLPFPELLPGADGAMRFRYRYRLGAEDVGFAVETSVDLNDWQTLPDGEQRLVEDSMTDQPGTGLRVLAFDAFLSDTRYYRLRVFQAGESIP